MSPVTEVQERIGEIRTRIAQLDSATAVPPLVMGGTTAGRGSAEFAGVLSATAGPLTRASRSTAPAPAAATPAATGEALVTTARKYLGVPYLYGGTDPGKGLDCSGLVQLVARENGITLPRTAAQQAQAGTAVPSLAQARPGDLVVLQGGGHIGIYVGDGQMLHAPRTGGTVRIAKVWETPMTIRRITPDAAAVRTPDSFIRPANIAPVAGSAESAPYEAAFAAAERTYGLPAGLLSAVAEAESGYDPKAKSPAGALGLMQFMPATAREMRIDPFDPFQAIDGAGRLLSSHLQTFGSLPLALAAYNAGPGNVRKHGGIPPFSETQNYVKKITATLGSTA